MIEMITDFFAQFGSDLSNVLIWVVGGIGIIAAIIFGPGMWIYMAVKLIKGSIDKEAYRKRKNREQAFCANFKIQYDEQKVKETVIRNSQLTDNIFLKNDITIEIADTICNYIAKQLRPSKEIITKKSSKSSEPKNTGEYIANIHFKITVNYKGIIVRSDTLTNDTVHEREVFSFEKNHLQKMNTSIEEEELTLALFEYIPIIINTPSAREFIQNEYPTVSIRKFHDPCVRDIYFQIPNPDYVTPEPPKKWY